MSWLRRYWWVVVVCVLVFGAALVIWKTLVVAYALLAASVGATATYTYRRSLETAADRQRAAADAAPEADAAADAKSVAEAREAASDAETTVRAEPTASDQMPRSRHYRRDRDDGHGS